MSSTLWGGQDKQNSPSPPKQDTAAKDRFQIAQIDSSEKQKAVNMLVTNKLTRGLI